MNNHHCVPVPDPPLAAPVAMLHKPVRVQMWALPPDDFPDFDPDREFFIDWDSLTLDERLVLDWLLNRAANPVEPR